MTPSSTVASTARFPWLWIICRVARTNKVDTGRLQSTGKSVVSTSAIPNREYTKFRGSGHFAPDPSLIKGPRVIFFCSGYKYRNEFIRAKSKKDLSVICENLSGWGASERNAIRVTWSYGKLYDSFPTGKQLWRMQRIPEIPKRTQTKGAEEADEW